MELTTKSACVPLEVSGVDTYAHVSEFHELVDRSVAYVRTGGVLWRFVVWQLSAQAVLLKQIITVSSHVCTASLACFSSHLNESAFTAVN